MPTWIAFRSTAPCSRGGTMRSIKTSAGKSRGESSARTILTPAQVCEIGKKLNEPYATLVLFLAITGLRIGEAVAIKPSDFDGDVLRVRRRICEGKSDTTTTKKSARDLPIPEVLCSRLFPISGREWIFESANGTPVNPGKALKRYVHPAVRSLGIKIGGWHDFRHTCGTILRKHGWSAKVRADILGHSSLQVTDGVYDHADQQDFCEALAPLAIEMLRDIMKSKTANY
jgi:integrase